MNNDHSNGVHNMWYSVRRGGVHFVSINTETDFPGAEESDTGDGHFTFLPAGHFGKNGQYLAWLKNDLEMAAIDPTVRWIIASGHRPFEDLPTNISSLISGWFKQARVAFYFAGHGHTYMRYNASAWGDDTIHIMVGGSGCDEMPYPSDQMENSIIATEMVKERCEKWCHDFDKRQEERQENLGVVKNYKSSCRFCTGADATPVATIDKYSLGYLKIEFDTLEFNLLRAPDGLVLDAVIVTHA